jgi:LPS-assembly protein
LHTQNAGINFQYNPLPNHIFNVGYNFLRYGDALTAEPPQTPPTILPNVSATSSQNNLSQPGFSFVWPVFDQWQVVGSWNYNLSHEHSQAYFFGLEYDSCCWAVRFVQAHTFSSLNNTGSPQYANTLYLQLELKGLGNIGTNDPTSLLLSSIPGYQENFGQL